MASAQTMEAGPVTSSKDVLGPGADALGKSQRQVSTCSGETSTRDCGQLEETGRPSGCRAVSEAATSGEQSTTVSSARKRAALLKLPSQAAWSTEQIHCGDRSESETLAGFCVELWSAGGLECGVTASAQRPAMSPAFHWSSLGVEQCICMGTASTAGAEYTFW